LVPLEECPAGSAVAVGVSPLVCVVLCLRQYEDHGVAEHRSGEEQRHIRGRMTDPRVRMGEPPSIRALSSISKGITRK
jgi:hypothetical protein